MTLLRLMRQLPMAATVVAETACHLLSKEHLFSSLREQPLFPLLELRNVLKLADCTREPYWIEYTASDIFVIWFFWLTFVVEQRHLPDFNTYRGLLLFTACGRPTRSTHDQDFSEFHRPVSDISVCLSKI